MPLVIEKDVESYLVKSVKERGGMCLKYPTLHTEGIPDRIVLLPKGKVAFVELKRPKGGRLAPIQEYQIGKLRNLGITAVVASNKEAIDRVLEELERNEE